MSPRNLQKAPSYEARSFTAIALLTAAAQWCVACGGAVPLLHPAHVLPQNRVTFGTGVANQVALGNAARVIDRGKATATGYSVSPDNEQAFVKGSLVDHAIAPGLEPWAGARVGLGHDHEAGVIYTGRDIRVDARHAFEDQKMALSVGLGLSAVLTRSSSDRGERPPDGPNRIPASSSDFSAVGWGIDVPILWGVRSSGHLFEFWSGARFGYERVFGDVRLFDRAPSPADSTPPNSMAPTEITDVERQYAQASVGRLYAEALVGLSVGVPPVFVRLELGGGAHRLSGRLDFPDQAGNPNTTELHLTAESLSTAGAVVLEF